MAAFSWNSWNGGSTRKPAGLGQETYTPFLPISTGKTDVNKVAAAPSGAATEAQDNFISEKDKLL